MREFGHLGIIKPSRGAHGTQVTRERFKTIRRDAGHGFLLAGRRLVGHGGLPLADHRPDRTPRIERFRGNRDVPDPLRRLRGNEPRVPENPVSPGNPGDPRSPAAPRRVTVRLLGARCARRRRARSLRRPARSSPHTAQCVLPGGTHPSRPGSARVSVRGTVRRRSVGPVGVRRIQAGVRCPVLTSGNRSAICRPCRRGPARYRSAAREVAVGSEATGRKTAGRRAVRGQAAGRKTAGRRAVRSRAAGRKSARRWAARR
jgi:hypothetical protein